jgi:TonB family protein
MRRTIRLLFAGALAIAGWAGSTMSAHAGTPAAAPVVAAPTKPEPALTTTGPGGDYLKRFHSRMHGKWTEDFIRTVASTYPATHTLNNPSREVTVAVTIRWDGTIAEMAVKKSSGAPEFDRAAMDVARKSAPFPLPPQDIVSDDSYAHLEWTFARDFRACAAGAHISRVDDPVDISLPRLIRVNRIGEALRRVADAAKDETKPDGDAGLDRFARLYLGRTNPDPVLTIAASVALAEAGDRTQAPRLRAALASRPTMEMAVRGLRKLSVDICEATHDAMETGTPPARELAIAAVRNAASGGANLAGCKASLSAIVADGRASAALRLSALETIQTNLPDDGRAVVMSVIEDKDPAVRAVALLASVKKGGGRPEMYRLAPMLHDKAVEIRGAASAGMVRAGGDQALEQLYLLARETDPRPAQLVATELSHLSSAASAEFLGKMLKRNNVQIQVAAARALASRKDGAARKELEPIKTDTHVPSEVRAIAAGEAKPADDKAATGKPVVVASAAADPLRQMLKDNRHHEAAGWIIEKFESLEPTDAIDVLGAWLRRSPTSAQGGVPAQPADPAATQTPAAAPASASAVAM